MVDREPPGTWAQRSSDEAKGDPHRGRRGSNRLPSRGCGAGPAAPFVYVTNSGSNDVSQYDIGAGGLLAPLSPAAVATGIGPLAVAVSPDGGSVYVGDGPGVSQYDIGPGGALAPKSPATVAIGPGSFGIAVSPDGGSVYVTGPTRRLSVRRRPGRGAHSQDPGHGGHRRLPDRDSGEPRRPKRLRRHQWLFGRGSVSQYDVGAGGTLPPKTPASVAAGHRCPFQVAVSPDGESVYVTNLLRRLRLPVRRRRGRGAHAQEPGHGGDRLAAHAGWRSAPTAGASTSIAGDGVSQYDVGAGGALSPKSPATVPPAPPLPGVAVGPTAGASTSPTGSTTASSSTTSARAGRSRLRAPPRWPPATTRRGGGEPGASRAHQQGAVQERRLAQLPAVQERGAVHRVRQARPVDEGGRTAGVVQNYRFGRRMKVKSTLDAPPPICESSTRAPVDDQLKRRPGGLDLPRCLAA